MLTTLSRLFLCILSTDPATDPPYSELVHFFKFFMRVTHFLGLCFGFGFGIGFGFGFGFGIGFGIGSGFGIGLDRM